VFPARSHKFAELKIEISELCTRRCQRSRQDRFFVITRVEIVGERCYVLFAYFIVPKGHPTIRHDASHSPARLSAWSSASAIS
jgi:hypothetical protein